MALSRPVAVSVIRRISFLQGQDKIRVSNSQILFGSRSGEENLARPPQNLSKIFESVSSLLVVGWCVRIFPPTTKLSAMVFGTLSSGALSALSLASSSSSSSPISTSPPCDLSSSASSYIVPANAVLQCLNLADIDLSGLSRLQNIDLSTCASNLALCQSAMQTEVSQHPNSLFAQVVSKLMTSPELTCPCVTNAAASFGSCFPLFGHLASYCELVQGTSASASLTVAGQSCSQMLKNVCPTTDFQQMMSCFESHVTELEGKCSVPLNAMLANVYSDCETDLALHCSSGYVLSCLQNNFESLSQQCQAQVQGYLTGGSDYPCLEESKLLCPSLSEPEEVLECLSEYLDTKHKFSQSCQKIVAGFKICSAEEAGAEAGSGSGEPIPPPAPRQGGDSEGPPSEEQNSEPKPAPGDKPQPQTQRSLQKAKPTPKPKPGPGEKPCWARGESGSGTESNPETNDGTDLLNSHSETTSSHNSGTSSSSIRKPPSSPASPRLTLLSVRHRELACALYRRCVRVLPPQEHPRRRRQSAHREGILEGALNPGFPLRRLDPLRGGSRLR
jgi:hypothetical protein